MKKLLVVFFLVATTTFFADAQESGLKPFKVDVSIGYASPGGTGAKAGVLFAIEPKYAVMNNLSLGLRMEAAVIARFSGYDADGNADEADVKASGSYVATADYYFSDNYAVRPFAGAGAGLFTLAREQFTGSSAGVDVQTSKFGGVIRGGVELRHFRIGIEYNFVPKSKFAGYDMNGDPTTLNGKNSYLGIKLGVCIGGGPR